MNILFPFKRQKNKFLDEIEPYFKGNFIYKEFDDSTLDINKIDVINIHWPEAIFDWKSPTDSRLNSFKEKFNKWLKKKKIIYTRHNIYPHTLRTDNFIELYDFVCYNVHGVIHLGKYSVDDYKKRYKNSKAKHAMIEHPMYLSIKKQKFIYKNHQKPKNSRINLLVFGSIRLRDELNLILSAFSKLEKKYKIIFSSNVIFYPFLIRIFYLQFLYKFIYRLFYKIKGVIFLEKGYVDEKFLIKLINQSDILIVPRIDLLNSGNLYLGLTFQKHTVVPRVGNISEKINKYNLFGYDSNDTSSLAKAIAKASDNLEIKIKCFEHLLHPKKIAESKYNFFKNNL